MVIVVGLCGAHRPGVFVVGCGSVGANAHRAIGRGAAGAVGGRAAFGGIGCLCDGHEQEQSDDGAGHTVSPKGKMPSAVRLLPTRWLLISLWPTLPAKCRVGHDKSSHVHGSSTTLSTETVNKLGHKSFTVLQSGHSHASARHAFERHARPSSVGS